MDTNELNSGDINLIVSGLNMLLLDVEKAPRNDSQAADYLANPEQIRELRDRLTGNTSLANPAQVARLRDRLTNPRP